MDLDDARAVAAADPGRLLALASTGALIRELARGRLPSAAIVAGAELGSASVLVSDLMPMEYADVLADLLLELGAPVAASPAVLDPTSDYPRAADLVVVASVSGGEHALLAALQLAAGRGATVIAAAPEGSPIAAAAAERRALLLLSPPDDPDATWWAAYAGCVAAFRGAAALEGLADALDDAAAELGPIRATYENPAKQLAVLDGPLLLIATDGPGRILARALAAELGSTPFRPVRCIDVRRGIAELVDIGRSAGGRGTHDLFYDPLIDGGPGSTPSWQLVLLPTVRGDELADDAVRAAESIGALLSLSQPSDRAEWTAAGLVLLAKISGAYRALQQRERE
ncbi:hypothetical protein [Cumulibacter manganitolerans]|uniref:hypothetical protein n=1 Tax=Cumulibacter manganitolerans TaxID=1884992 RepID=UPI00129674B7|nr:hypothetical protein [Cumulibacter manganitolerans]